MSLELFTNQQLYDKLSLPIDLINIIYSYTIETDREKIRRLASEFRKSIKSNQSITILDIDFTYNIKQKCFIIRYIDGNIIMSGRVKKAGKSLCLFVDDIGLLRLCRDPSIQYILIWMKKMPSIVGNLRICIAGFLFAVYKIEYKL